MSMIEFKITTKQIVHEAIKDRISVVRGLDADDIF
jgi:hypothetical protein